MAPPYNVAALYAFDCSCEQRDTVRVVGIDEAGRGPLAGPVVAAAVMLDLARPIDGIFDSKKIAPKKRRRLFDIILAKAQAWAVGQASADEVDRHNILQATFLAMRRALDGISMQWSRALIDGNLYLPALDRAVQQPVVKGDGLSASIAAASIVAKVTRDGIMEEYHRRYPQWEFALHKGYPTARHRELIGKYGLCSIHRKSFCNHFMRHDGIHTTI